VNGQRDGIGIGTFFYYALREGFDIKTPETKMIIEVAKQRKRSNQDQASAVRFLKEQDITEEQSSPIVAAVFASPKLKDDDDLSLIERTEIFLRSNYDLKKNEITRQQETSEGAIDDYVLNSIYVQALKSVGKETSFEMIVKLIDSDFTPIYNPIKDFFESIPDDYKPQGLIKELAACIETDTGLVDGNFDPEYVEYYLTRWLVGMVSSVYGSYSLLCLVLTGEGNTGKTEFFRRLFPEALKPFYAESKLDEGKDAEILMSRCLAILDDEFGGKSKLEAKKFKEMTSKQSFDLREPYGRKTVKLNRLAVLCGTSNDSFILNDPSTENRRIIPINVVSIDYERFNNINKDHLFWEMYLLYKEGFQWRLTGSDIKRLGQNTESFRGISAERDLIQKYFTLPTEDDLPVGAASADMTPTDIKVYIEVATGQKLNSVKLGNELKSLGFKQKQVKRGGKNSRVYSLIKIKVR
jgi:predicted P-loop ATPase